MDTETKWMRIEDLKVEEPFVSLFEIDPANLKATEKDMIRHGYRSAFPITVWKGIVIDGHVRLQAVKDLVSGKTLERLNQQLQAVNDRIVLRKKKQERKDKRREKKGRPPLQMPKLFIEAFDEDQRKELAALIEILEKDGVQEFESVPIVEKSFGTEREAVEYAIQEKKKTHK